MISQTLGLGAIGEEMTKLRPLLAQRRYAQVVRGEPTNEGSLFSPSKGCLAGDGPCRLGRCKRTSSLLNAIDAELMRRIDEQFIGERQHVRQALQESSGMVLYGKTVKLVEAIDALCTDKTIRSEVVAQRTSRELWQEHSQQRSVGAMKADHRALAAQELQQSTKASRSAEETRRQLLLQGSDYRVAVRKYRGNQIDDKALTITEARVMLGMMLDAHEAIYALKSKAPLLAAMVSPWLEHSRVCFELARCNHRPGNPSFTQVMVQLGHPHHDALGLQPHGIVSQRFADYLLSEIRGPLETGLQAGSLLLAD